MQVLLLSNGSWLTAMFHCIAALSTVYSMQAYSLANEQISQKVINCNYWFGWLYVVWWITDDSPNFPIIATVYQKHVCNKATIFAISWS